MGHQSENLVGIAGLEMYAGIILSPVNRPSDKLQNDVEKFHQAGFSDIVLDPQIYFPRFERGSLDSHPYFSTDLDTADLSSERWWQHRIDAIAEYCIELGVDTVCSPMVIPAGSRWTTDYYARSTQNYHLLKRSFLSGKVFMTVIIGWEQMDSVDEALRIASVITQAGVPEGIYLVLQADISPRRELSDDQKLLGLMVLISALEAAGCRVLVSHCSAEMVLLKAAGATHCATGKSFNVRRFTQTRFTESEESGGRQIPYWFEHSLLSFLREADIRRIQQQPLARHLISTDPSGNAFGVDILTSFTNAVASGIKTPWLGLSWRQYLCWFANAENMLSDQNKMSIAAQWLQNADEAWGKIEEYKVFLEERPNDGSWIRSWLQALTNFGRFN